MSLDLGQLALWQNITLAVLVGLTFIFSVIKLFKFIGFTESGLGKLLLKEQIIAKPGFNRWWVPVASVSIHLCIGSVYAWSIFNPALIKTIGIVTSSANDWVLKEVVWIYSTAIVFLGLSAAFAGSWLEKVGPRMVGLVAAFCWGGGFLIGGLGIIYHQLWLIYLGYGVIGGCGLGLGYVSPVATLIRWFPDRRGMATGMAIMGFGGGAFFGARIKDFFIQYYYKAPEILSNISESDLITKAGKRFAETAEGLKEVVVIGVNDVANMIVPGDVGVYLVGTGSVGISQTFFTLGAIYFLVMTIAALSYRVPSKDWFPKGWVPPSDAEIQKKMITTKHVHIDEALRTPQFYLLWVILCFNVTAGIGVLGVAKTMITEIFQKKAALIVTSAFTTWYVMLISIFNMAGRFIWASASDYIGRKNTYYCFFILGIILYSSIPISAQTLDIAPVIVWLILFYGATLIIFTMYGGGFATIPAYLADMFGTRYVGGIHGRLLTAWSTAGVLGPVIITSIRGSSINNAINDLSSKVNPQTFSEKFGTGIENLNELVKAKTVTIQNLLEILPPGTPDPTSQVYNKTMIVMACLLGVALIANFLVKPVDSKHHMK
ncbi:MAG: putative MFS-type transporter YhjX [Alphaproteobacteria bacterium MarineAlpha6_Bin2]|nr:MAG: putative MFS-type transporter YhjX [Alphaproteobacteria bacterium MarineAlpha6_Bin2]